MLKYKTGLGSLEGSNIFHIWLKIYPKRDNQIIFRSWNDNSWHKMALKRRNARLAVYIANIAIAVSKFFAWNLLLFLCIGLKFCLGFFYAAAGTLESLQACLRIEYNFQSFRKDFDV